MGRVSASIFTAALISLAGHAVASSPAPAAAHGPVITDPDWVELPNSDDLADAYPPLARQGFVTGDAKVQCSVAADGGLYGCFVTWESPPGWAFGQATLALAPKFRMKPMLVDGKPADGGKVVIPVHWRLGPPDKADLHQPSEEDLALAREIVGLQHLDPARGLIADLYSVEVAPTASKIDAERAKALNAAWNDAVVTLRSDLEARLARAAAQVYSHQELVDILAFFQSASGKAYLERYPEMWSLAMLDSRDAVRKFVDAVQAAYCGQGACGAAEAELFKALHTRVEALPQSQ